MQQRFLLQILLLAYQEHPHTAPTTLDTPYNKPR